MQKISNFTIGISIFIIGLIIGEVHNLLDVVQLILIVIGSGIVIQSIIKDF